MFRPMAQLDFSYFWWFDARWLKSTLGAYIGAKTTWRYCPEFIAVFYNFDVGGFFVRAIRHQPHEPVASKAFRQF
jgi:hypothetical protein